MSTDKTTNSPTTGDVVVGDRIHLYGVGDGEVTSIKGSRVFLKIDGDEYILPSFMVPSGAVESLKIYE